MEKNLKKIITITVLVSFFTSALVGFVFGSLSGSLMTDLVNPVIDNYLNFNKNSDSNENNLANENQNAGKDLSIVEVVKKVSPAVVSIVVSKDLPLIEQYWYNPFGEDSPFDVQIPGYRQKGTEKKEIGGGTGFIISSDGLILTNKHVVSFEGAQYSVLTNDGQNYQAEVLAQDPVVDIAILKINQTNLPVVELGNSDNLEIGQTVIAIGNALGEFQNTVSRGIISGLKRTVVATGPTGQEELREVIQTDAAVNQGNSGGPLVNLRGQVIGINVARSQEAENIGFAIPINQAKKDIDDVRKYGRLVIPFLGIRYVLINKTTQEQNNLPVDYGALVIRGEGADQPAVVPGSAADKAGIKENDIILEFNGTKIDSQNSLADLILSHQVGEQIELKILRQNQEIILKATLEERK